MFLKYILCILCAFCSAMLLAYRPQLAAHSLIFFWWGGGGEGLAGGGGGGGVFQRFRLFVQHTVQDCGTRHVVTAFGDHAHFPFEASTLVAAS